MKNGTYYLNNNGDKWVIYENGKKIACTWTTESGQKITRTPIHFFSFGNFGGALIQYKRERIQVLIDTILKD